MTTKPFTYHGMHAHGAREGAHFYDRVSGFFSGAMFVGSEEAAKAQAEHRGEAVYFGTVDWLSQRVDLSTGELVDYRPDPPHDGTDLTRNVWVWDVEARRWRARPRRGPPLDAPPGA